ncbi:MAG: HAD family hydrolase [Treponema sp.]|nr:HAD family hydrolase [Treponema sp.]
MRTLYVSDLDGTLLNKNDCINARSLEIINGLVAGGMFFTYATARSLTSACTVTRGLNVRNPVIVYNGTFIMESNTGRFVSSEGFSSEEQVFIREKLTAGGISPFVYSFIAGEEKVSYDGSCLNEGKERYLSLRKGDKRFRRLDGDAGLYDGEMFYFTCIGEKGELEGAYRLFEADGRFTCTFQQELYRPEWWFEIMPKKATKYNGILKLKKLLGCDRIVSFGDAVNDIPMFKISDECYAVENAVPELKAIATGIIGSNESDGVALWLRDHAGW